MRSLISGLLVCGALLAQKPAVFPKGVVNAATYATEYPNNLVAPGSIVSIFGTNLAASTAWADMFPLPTTLAGTSVTFGGLAAPLFYVSPGQINAQVPGATSTNLFLPPVPVVVTTGQGASDPVDVRGFFQGLGIFTLDSSGCGRGAVFNVAPDGSVSLNGPDNSVDPNGILTIFGTGFGLAGWRTGGPVYFVFHAVPDGEPAPKDPLAKSEQAVFGSYTATAGSPLYAGRAPGLVGVDQINTVLNNAPEGCSVPFRLAGYSQSQNIPISVHKGGGQCVDPAPTSLAYLKWRKIVASSGIDPAPASDSLIIDISSAIIGKQFPRVIHVQSRPPGPACPDFNQNRDLDAGVLTLTGPGLGSVEVRRATVNGKLTYTASLPAGSIGAGTYTVKASGGADVGPFETSATLPAPIELTSPFPPTLQYAPLTITWKGGDSNSTVGALYLVPILTGLAGQQTTYVPASAGKLTLDLTHQVIRPNSALAIVQIPNGSPQPFQAQGLTLGGQHTWRYEFLYRQGPLLPE